MIAHTRVSEAKEKKQKEKHMYEQSYMHFGAWGVLDFERLTIIVNSLVSRGFKREENVKGKSSRLSVF